MTDPGIQEQFERDGYIVVPGFLNPEEAAGYRRAIADVFDLPQDDVTAAIDGATMTLADGVTIKPRFWPLIFHPQLLAGVRSVLGPDIRYTQHSDLHINLRGGRWHRDNACRQFDVGPDWDESEAPYKVVRIAIYLSDYADSGSSLMVLPGSHRTESWLQRREYTLWNKLRSAFRRRGQNDRVPHWFFSRPAIRLKTKPGDCVIFDQRVMHAGGVLRGQEPKYAIYLSYGVENLHSHNHRAFFLDRPTYTRELPAELSAKLEDAGLLLPETNPTTSQA
jgi:hypothetical protein